MFPPKQSGPPSPAGPPKPPGPGGPGGPGGGMDLLSLLAGGGGGMPGGIPGGMPMPGMGGPMGGGQPGSGPGMPPPGQGMNAMNAMQNGLGMPPPPPAPVGVNGPGGLPLGGQEPGPGGPGDFGGSDLLSMLSQGGGGMPSGDPYDQPPGAYPLEDVGQDPTGGLGGPNGMMSMLALAAMGVDPSQAMNPMGGMGMGGPPMGGPMGF